MTSSTERLDQFLSERGITADITAIRADASTREYYRLVTVGGSTIACVYPDDSGEAVRNYVDVTTLFLRNGLPVAGLLDHSVELGVVIQEDLGDQILNEVLPTVDPAEKDRLIGEAIELIVRIQSATDDAFDSGSIASKLRFDIEKLLWELDYFKTHYFETYAQRPLSAAEDAAIVSEFDEIAKELDSRARVLCHRDFHAANLMLGPSGELRIIDHQDARIGSVTYDLVSLLLDRLSELPSPAWIAEKQKLFLALRERHGLDPIDADEFAAEFALQAIQRCLKAAGTFSYQSAVRDKKYFIPYIKPMFAIASSAAESLDRFPAIQTILAREMDR